MKILMITEVLPAQFAWNPHGPVRGTETFYVETAKAMAIDGHLVDVVYDGPFVYDGVFVRSQGVGYYGREELSTEQGLNVSNYDRVIFCNPRANDPKPTGLIVNRTTVWTNFYFDRQAEYSAWADSLPEFNDLVVISPFALNLLPLSLQRKARVVPHGVHHSFYQPVDPEINGVIPRQKRVAFTSSPDRGLAQLRKIWEDYDILNELGYELVTGDYGRTTYSKKAMSDLLQSCAFWVHPGEGKELFCLAAAEAQAAGCTPIVVPTGALATTVLHGYRFTASGFVSGLVGVLSGDAGIPDINASHIPSWEAVTRLLLGRTDSLLM